MDHVPPYCSLFFFCFFLSLPSSSLPNTNLASWSANLMYICPLPTYLLYTPKEGRKKKQVPNKPTHPHTGFLSESWHVSSNGAFAASCIGAVLLVMIMEVLRRLGKEYDDWVLRGFQTQAAAVNAAASAATTSTTTFALPMKNGGVGGVGGFLRTSPVTTAEAAAAVAVAGSSSGMRMVVFRASPLQQLIRSILHAVSLGLAYIVMLLVMSFNGYIIICVILGAGLGKFFCDWMTRPMLVDLGGARGIEEPSVCCN